MYEYLGHAIKTTQARMHYKKGNSWISCVNSCSTENIAEERIIGQIEKLWARVQDNSKQAAISSLYTVLYVV